GDGSCGETGFGFGLGYQFGWWLSNPTPPPLPPVPTQSVRIPTNTTGVYLTPNGFLPAVAGGGILWEALGGAICIGSGVCEAIAVGGVVVGIAGLVIYI